MKFFKVFCAFTYFIILIYIVFFVSNRRSTHYNYELNLIPFQGTIDTFFGLNYADKKEVYNFYINLFGNIGLFIPFSIILRTTFKIYKFKTLFFLTMLFSISIEILQYFFQIGVADIDDVILNLLGAVIGIFLYRVIFRRNFSPIKS